MKTWPFPNIPPEHFAALADEDRDLLEALTQAYLAEIELRRQRASLDHASTTA